MEITITVTSTGATTTPASITRGLLVPIKITLAGLALPSVVAWELGVTEDFRKATPVLAGTAELTIAGQIISGTLNTNTVELAAFMEGSKASGALMTLKGYNGSAVAVVALVVPVTLLNVGYEGDDIAVNAGVELFYDKAQVNAMFADVAATIGVPTDISQLGDSTGLFTAKEDVANKATDFSAPDDTTYPTTLAVATLASGKVDTIAGKGLSTNDYDTNAVNKVAKIQLETLTPITGATATIAPWTQSAWTVTGTCTLTASGWAGAGLQSSALLIDVAAGATIAVSGATVAEDDAISGAGQYMVYLINQNGTVYFRVANYTEAL